MKIIICVDGLGKDLISVENTPFLYEFGKKNYFAELKTLFAFPEEYCFLSGKTPIEHGKWFEFEKVKKSIFNNFLIRICSFNNKLRNYAGAIIQFINGRTWLAGTYNIPSEKLKYFDSSIKQGLWNLEFFKGQSFAVYKWPFFVTRNKNRIKLKLILKYETDSKRLQKLLNKKDKEIYYTQLMEIDKTIHKFGKKSKETKKVLNKIDNLLKRVVNKILDENKTALVCIWSDHGFSDIKNYINLEKILPKRKDYLYFIAGTTAHFWFENENAKKEILKTISKIQEIKILNKSLAKKYKIPFSKKYGEIILFVEKNNYFFPNFYQKSEKEKFVSMHGYPDDKELNGIFITNKKIPNKLKIYEAIGYIK